MNHSWSDELGHSNARIDSMGNARCCECGVKCYTCPECHKLIRSADCKIHKKKCLKLMH